MNSDTILNNPAAGVALNDLGITRALPASAPAESTSVPKHVDAKAVASSPQPLSPDEQARQVKAAVAESNQKLQAANSPLNFQFDLASNGSVRSVKLLNSTTHEVVLQFPSEEMLSIRDSIDKMIESNASMPPPGTLFSKTA